MEETTMKLDYTMAVPKEIQEMAMKIEDHFIRQGIYKWALMNVCSRNHITDVEFLREKLHRIKVEVDKAYENTMDCREFYQ